MVFARGGLKRTGRNEEAAGAGPRFADVFAVLPIAVLVIDADGRIAHANTASEHLLNLSERSMRGQGLAAVIDLPQGYEEGRDGRGFAAFDIELSIVKAGRIRADFVETMVADYDGWRIVTIHQAATARRTGLSLDRSAGARAAIGAAAMLAHEIKNPLSGIRGAAQLLGTGDGSSEDNAELTGLITTEVDRIAALIDRMQDFTDTRQPDIKPVNIYPLLDHVRNVALAGFSRTIPIEERFDPSLPPAMIDGDAFLQIMINLIKNAVEALDLVSAPSITLATAYRHGMSVSAGPGRPRQPLPIEVLVIDNGPGAPLDIADHLFEPFVSGKREGKGLGLPMVEKLTGQMGGIVEYAREGDPEMTVFRLLLPRGHSE